MFPAKNSTSVEQRVSGKLIRIDMAALLAKSIAVLAASLALVAFASASLLASRYGEDAWLASGLAAGLIWALGAASLAMIAMAPTPHARLNAALLGMLVRMTLPMAVVVYFTRQQGPLAEAGINLFIVIQYLAGLFVETLLAVRLIKHTCSSAPPQPALT